jgi:peptidoglycan/xylan/chitin deacetylase (PgdA/CDA1 family)
MIGEIARRLAVGVDRALGRPRGLILLYHRVVDAPSDPYGLCVSPSDFEEHLEVLRTAYQPTPVAELARAADERRLPDRAIGVTFDDAYVDVLENAVPLLRRYEVPATVFVTVGPGGRTREFWWDELERVFRRPGRLPQLLTLEIDGRSRRWDLGADATWDERRGEIFRDWHLFDDHVPTARHAVFREIYLLLRPLSDAARARVMDGLLAWAGDAPAAMRATHRVMTPEEVAAMTADGLVTAGAHTVTHPDLPSCPEADQHEETLRSKLDLEAWTGRRVHGFAYPYGLYDDRSVEAVRRVGYDFACSGDHRSLRRGAPRLLLPRVDVPRGGGDVLGALLRRYVG